MALIQTSINDIFFGFQCFLMKLALMRMSLSCSSKQATIQPLYALPSGPQVHEELNAKLPKQADDHLSSLMLATSTLMLATPHLLSVKSRQVVINSCHVPVTFSSLQFANAFAPPLRHV